MVGDLCLADHGWICDGDLLHDNLCYTYQDEVVVVVEEEDVEVYYRN